MQKVVSILVSTGGCFEVKHLGLSAETDVYYNYGNSLASKKWSY
jgi:hypothetical protein